MFLGQKLEGAKKWVAGAALVGALIGTALGHKKINDGLYRRATHERYSVVEEDVGEKFTRDLEKLEKEIYSELKDDRHMVIKRNQYFNNRKYDLMNYSEINVVNTLLEEFNDQETVNQVSELVKKDLEKDSVVLNGVSKKGEYGEFTVDTADTEIGGVVEYTDSLDFVPYQSRITLDNHTYCPTDHRLGEDSLANFHLHATGTDSNFMYEGPSEQDLKTAKHLNKPGVVITYLGNSPDERILINADFYTADGIVLDLGVYESDIRFEDGELLDESFYDSLF